MKVPDIDPGDLIKISNGKESFWCIVQFFTFESKKIFINAVVDNDTLYPPHYGELVEVSPDDILEVQKANHA